MRVVIANQGIFPYSRSGMARHTAGLAHCLHALGVEVEVVIPPAETKNRVEFQYKVTELPDSSVARTLGGFYSWSKHLHGYLSSHPCDCLYAQGFNGWAVLEHKRQLALPVLYNPHGLEIFKTSGVVEALKSFQARKAARFQASHADRTVSLGGRMHREIRDFLGIGDDRIVELPNAVDLAYLDSFATARIAKKQRQLLYVGSLESSKGIELLCEAFRTFPDHTLIIAGSGSLSSLLKKTHSGGNIKFIGAIEDRRLFELYQQSEALICSSICDGMPRVIMEAMCYCLPVIATDNGAVDTLVNPDTGYLIQPGSVESLREAIGALVTLPEDERLAMGKAARHHLAHHFNWPHIARKTLDAIQSIVG